jgi:hypothetical protein
MTRDEILAMKAGRNLNIMISEEIMGTKVVHDEIFGDVEIRNTDQGEPFYGPLIPYSEDLSSAQLVILRMANLGFPEVDLWEDEKRPEVICRAALLALLGKGKKEKVPKKRPKLYLVR